MEEAQLEVVPYSITIGYPHLSADHVLKVRACQVPAWLILLLQVRHVACGFVDESRVKKWTEEAGCFSISSFTCCPAQPDVVMMHAQLVLASAQMLGCSSPPAELLASVCQQLNNVTFVITLPPDLDVS